MQDPNDSTWRLLVPLLGLRQEGLAAAAVVPALLTAVLFLGPLCMAAWDAWRPAAIKAEQRSLVQVRCGALIVC
jgi:hypothetical protein